MELENGGIGLLQITINIRKRNNLRHCLYMWTYDQVLSKESDINL
jgi:hypothetical protein